MAKLNKTNFQIRLKRGLRANADAAATYVLEGEIGYTTDTPALWIGQSDYRLHLVPDLRRAVVYGGDVVTHDGEIVWAI